MRITDGANAGRTATTTSNGSYSFSGLTAANANVFVNAGCYNETGKGVYINGTTALDFTLDGAPAWSKSGVGDTVFDMPTCVSRVHATGRYPQNSSNFIVHIRGGGWINELLGTAWGTTTYDGTLLSGGGGTVEVMKSSGVSWSFTEIKQ